MRSLWSALRSIADSAAAPVGRLKWANTRLAALRSAFSGYEAVRDGLLAAADTFHLDSSWPNASNEPKLKLHGAGGISLTSPEQVSAFAHKKVSVASPYKVSIKGGWSASMSSLGNAKLYGVVSATVQSEGIVGINGRITSVNGKTMLELKSEGAVALAAEKGLVVQAKEMANVNAPKVDVVASEALVLEGGDDVKIGSKSGPVQIAAPAGTVTIAAQNQVRAEADRVMVQAPGGTVIHAGEGRGRLVVQQDQVVMGIGQDRTVSLSSSEFKVWGLRVERGQVHLG